MNYPIFLNLHNKPVLLVGAGDVALRKINQLRQSNAKILLCAENILPEIKALIDNNSVEFVADTFQAALLDQAFLVIAATNDKALNQEIAALCEKKYKFCNVVDDVELSTAMLPSWSSIIFFTYASPSPKPFASCTLPVCTL